MSSTSTALLAAHDDHHHTTSKTLFGIWVFVLTDCILFSSILVSYQVLHNNTFGGVNLADIASLPYTYVQTLALLLSSLTYGISTWCVYRGKRGSAMFWVALTFLLGLVFMGMEIHEFSTLIAQGNDWTRSAFLSSFFLVVGAHGFHVLCGLLWMVVMLVQMKTQGLTYTIERRLACLGIFWHFLDIIWVFIFTLVYLMGVI